MNKDIKLRDSIVEPYFTVPQYLCGCRPYRNLPVEVMEKLISLDFVNLDEKFNNAPTIKTFVDFAKKYNVTFLGYAVSLDRKDYRFSVEGIEHHACPSREELIDFINTFKKADEIIVKNDHLYCWYD